MAKTITDRQFSWVNERRTLIKRMAELTKRHMNRHEILRNSVTTAGKQKEKEERYITDSLIFGGSL